MDEVAAEHICADGLIHFGHACMTKNSGRIKVLFVFTALRMDVDALISDADNEMRKGGKKPFLFYDVGYHRALSSARNRLDEVCHVCPPPDGEGEDEGEGQCVADAERPAIRCGRICQDPPGEEDVALYCGTSDHYRLLLAFNFPQCRLLVRHPRRAGLEDASSLVGAEVRRRFYLVEKVKDADRIGVLVGTLGAYRYREIVDHLVRTIRRRGKRPYIFLVGKPNVAKLANFPEVEVFVLVACPENSVVRSRKFMQPVVTPLELELALNPARKWTGRLPTDFQDILPGQREFVEMPQNMGEDEEVADVSLITGKVRSLRSREEGPDSAEESSASALMAQETSVSVLHERGGGDFLAGRSWKGLEQKLGETEVTKAVKGQSGIAMGYQGEGGEKQ